MKLNQRNSAAVYVHKKRDCNTIRCFNE